MHGKRMGIWLLATLAVLACEISSAAEAVDCSKFDIDPKGTKSLGAGEDASSTSARTCHTGFGKEDGTLPVPDARCTPGAVNPTVTEKVLRTPGFTTKCVRDNVSSPTEKAGTYGWYDIQHPSQNSGAMQTCELDHLISLELGGADSLDNIWPQCGPPDVVLRERFFKEKDMVENYLARQVKQGTMSLQDAQTGISTDWTRFLKDAQADCHGARCPATAHAEE